MTANKVSVIQIVMFIRDHPLNKRPLYLYAGRQVNYTRIQQTRTYALQSIGPLKYKTPLYFDEQDVLIFFFLRQCINSPSGVSWLGLRVLTGSPAHLFCPWGEPGVPPVVSGRAAPVRTPDHPPRAPDVWLQAGLMWRQGARDVMSAHRASTLFGWTHRLRLTVQP